MSRLYLTTFGLLYLIPVLKLIMAITGPKECLYKKCNSVFVHYHGDMKRFLQKSRALILRNLISSANDLTNATIIRIYTWLYSSPSDTTQIEISCPQMSNTVNMVSLSHSPLNVFQNKLPPPPLRCNVSTFRIWVTFISKFPNPVCWWICLNTCNLYNTYTKAYLNNTTQN